MADKSEGAGNLDVQKSINDAIAARTALLSKQTDIMRGQVELAVELCKAMKCDDLDSVASRVQEISTSLGAAQKEAQGLEDKLTGVSGAASGAAGSAGEMKKQIKASAKEAKSFGDIAGDAFSSTMAQLDSIVELSMSAGRGIFSIGQSILAIPLGIFSKLTEMASELANSIDPMRQALEDVRKAFGDLSKGEAAQTLNSFQNISSQSSNLAGSGMSLAKIYGHGRDGLAAALKDLTETAQAMGPVFGALGDQFEENAASLLILQKGLGMTGEDMKAYGSFALATGQDVNDVLMETANLSLQMGEKFGISSKLIGQDMAYMTQNMGKFGSMTKTQMATATVYVRKLGLEIKDVEGLIGVFDDFEGAATAASKLAQAFGMNVDAMQMMQEQDPAKRLDSLRQAFAATGKSIETMSRQEKALLAQTAGLDENTVSLALSQENMGMSYDEIQAAAEESGDQQLSQAEIMQKTAENIEKVVENLNKTTGSFLDTFLNGFMEGISRTEEFRDIMHNMAEALRMTFQFGKWLGGLFVDLFPGMKDMAGGLADIFDPTRFQAMLDEFKAVFEEFFTSLSKDPVKAVEDFMKKIQKIFFDKFDTESEGGSTFMDGLKKFGKAFVGILAGLGKMLIEEAAKAIKGLADYIRNPKGLSDSAEDGIMSMISPMIDALKSALPVLGEALLDLIGAVLKEYGPQIALVLSGLLAANLAAGFMGAVVDVGKTAVMDAAKEKLKSMITGFATPKVPPAQGDGGASVVETLGGVVEAFNKINMGQVMKAIAIAAIMAVFAAGSLIMFAAAVKQAAAILEQTKMEDIVKVFAAAGIGIMATMGLAITASLLMADGGTTLAIGALGMIAATLFAMVAIPGFALAVKGAAKILQDVPFETILKTFAALGVALLATAALALVGVGVGALLVTAGPLVILGLIAGAAMLYDGVMLFGAALDQLVKDFPDIPLDKVAKIMLVTVGAILGAAAIAAVGAVAATLSVGLLLAAAGIVVLSKFLTSTVSTLGGAINAIANIPMEDPEEMESRMNVVAGLVDSLSAFAGLAVSAAEIGVVSKLFGGGGISEAIGAMNSFMQTAVESIVGLVVVISRIASGYDEDQLKKMDVVSKVIASIATLAGALTGPMEALSKVDDSFFGDSASEKITSITGGLSDILDKIVVFLPGIIRKVISLPTEGLTPEKADSLSKVMAGIADITKAMNENSAALQKENFDASRIAADFNSSLSNTLIGLSYLNNYMPAIQANVDQIVKYKETQLSGSVKAIIDDIIAVNDAMAELGTVDIDATIGKVGAALGLKNEILKIESKPIQMTVNLNLTMKADDIAKEIMDVTAKTLKDKDKASDGMKELFPGF